MIRQPTISQDGHFPYPIPGGGCWVSPIWEESSNQALMSREDECIMQSSSPWTNIFQFTRWKFQSSASSLQWNHGINALIPWRWPCQIHIDHLSSVYICHFLGFFHDIEYQCERCLSKHGWLSVTVQQDCPLWSQFLLIDLLLRSLRQKSTPTFCHLGILELTAKKF